MAIKDQLAVPQEVDLQLTSVDRRHGGAIRAQNELELVVEYEVNKQCAAWVSQDE